MHLLEMADVTFSYAKSLGSGKLSFADVKEKYMVKDQNKKQVLIGLEKSNKFLLREINKIDVTREISAWGEKLTIIDILLSLIRHENLHHGQIIAFSYASKIKLPESWYENWALPPLL